MKKVMGTQCYTMKEAAKIYGSEYKNFWRILGRLSCPKMQPGGVGTMVYFPVIAFEQWLASERTKCSR